MKILTLVIILMQISLSTSTAVVLAAPHKVILDHSPAAVSGERSPEDTAFGFDNQASELHFGDQLITSLDHTLTGMDSYLATGGSQLPALGDSATIRIWEDQNGRPGDILHDFTDSIAVLDPNGVGAFSNVIRAHVAFTTPIELSAGSYWIGLSATTKRPFGFGQILIQGGVGATLDNRTATFFDDTGFDRFAPEEGDVAMRVYAQVPEPSTSLLMGLGVAGCFSRRRLHR